MYRNLNGYILKAENASNLGASNHDVTLPTPYFQEVRKKAGELENNRATSNMEKEASDGASLGYLLG